MSQTRWLLVMAVGAALVGLTWAAETAGKTQLPEAVAKAFKAEFPKGEIVKADEEKENGVTVYDIEFKEGTVERECDITADGTIMTVAIAVEAKQVPEAAMKAIKKEAGEATIGKISKTEIRAEAKDGKVTKLDKPKITYEAEVKKGDQTGELAVDEQGNVVEALKWEKSAETKPAK